MKTLLMGVAAALVLAVGAQAEAQQRAGVVTTLEGSVTVMRASLSEPAPLKFRDDIFVKDRIATAADSVARILLGGRAVVTVREHSVVTITEAPGLSTVDVVAGRAAVAVAREKMRAGDLIEVKTPNAVAGIRGTVIVAEVVDTDHSVITVLKGLIDVTRLDGGRAVGTPRPVRALERVVLLSGMGVPAPQRLSADDARHLGQQFRLTPPRSTSSPVTTAINEAQVERAVRHLAALDALPAAPRGGRDDDDMDGLREVGRRDRTDGDEERYSRVLKKLSQRQRERDRHAGDAGLDLDELTRARKSDESVKSTLSSVVDGLKNISSGSGSNGRGSYSNSGSGSYNSGGYNSGSGSSSSGKGKGSK